MEWTRRASRTSHNHITGQSSCIHLLVGNMWFLTKTRNCIVNKGNECSIRPVQSSERFTMLNQSKRSAESDFPNKTKISTHSEWDRSPKWFSQPQSFLETRTDCSLYSRKTYRTYLRKVVLTVGGGSIKPSRVVNSRSALFWPPMISQRHTDLIKSDVDGGLSWTT